MSVMSLHMLRIIFLPPVVLVVNNPAPSIGLPVVNNSPYKHNLHIICFILLGACGGIALKVLAALGKLDTRVEF